MSDSDALVVWVATVGAGYGGGLYQVFASREAALARFSHLGNREIHEDEEECFTITGDIGLGYRKSWGVQPIEVVEHVEWHTAAPFLHQPA